MGNTITDTPKIFQANGMTFVAATKKQGRKIALVGTFFETVPLLPAIVLSGCLNGIGFAADGIRKAVAGLKKAG